MMTRNRLATLAATTLALALSACATTQLTSGADYAARSAAYYAPKPAADRPKSSASVDADIAAIAAIEPSLVFPARIGLAHIRRGQLSAVPPEHLHAWQPLRERIEPRLGEVVPISPLIASMVAKRRTHDTPVHVVEDIRRGAARQHVDYVLVYETHVPKGRAEKNGLAFADWSILGLFMLPTREVDVQATASAVLLDVRNGYPYGTAGGVATKDALSTAYGSGAKRRKLGERAEEQAVVALAADVTTMFDALTDSLAMQRVATVNAR